MISNLCVQFVDVGRLDEDGCPREIAYFEHVSHALPIVGEMVVAYEPLAIYQVVSRQGWSIRRDGMFLRIELRQHLSEGPTDP